MNLLTPLEKKKMESITVINDFPMLKFHCRILSFYCSDCESCFKPPSVMNHFKNNHSDMDFTILRNMNFNNLLIEFTKQSHDLGFDKYTNDPFPIRKLEGFSVFKCLKCSISNCEFLVKESSPNLMKILRKDIKTDHANVSFCEDLFILSNCQSLSKGGGKKKFIEVSIEENESNDEETLRPSILDTSPPVSNYIHTIYDDIGFIYEKKNLNFLYELSCESLLDHHSQIHRRQETVENFFKEVVLMFQCVAGGWKCWWSWGWDRDWIEVGL